RLYALGVDLDRQGNRAVEATAAALASMHARLGVRLCSPRSGNADGVALGLDVVTAELPGVSEKDIQVDLAGDLLTIKGEKKSEHESRNSDGHRLERRFGAFERALRLPFEVKDEHVDAKCRNGVRTMRLPKPHDLQRSSRR